VGDTPIPLGPFDLDKPIGRGGMGEVWRGVHRGEGLPVAIKVLTGTRARDPSFAASFRNEVRAVAALHHPGIVMVFDHGRVEQEESEASDGELAAGSPYLAMELATGGSLHEVTAPELPALSWPELRTLLLTILDALAHAHARGIVHRDLKPANILLCNVEDSRPGLKVTDFGLAHAMEREPTHMGQLFSGTPNYMAPEQVRSEWRDYGPWTDLYALGCIAFELATGHRAFSGGNLQAILMAHLSHSAAAFIPQMPVPVGLDRWIARMFQRDRRHRFQRAADAAWALAQLGDPLEAQAATPAAPGADDNVDGVAQTVLLDEAHQETLLSEEAGGPPVGVPLATLVLDDTEERERAAGFDMPPLPLSWRRGEAGGPSMRLVGAGLGLYGLREIPLVDREPERDTLWATLRRVHAGGRVRVVLLHGPAGSGKSRLAEAVCERAHEVGSATVLKAFHDPTPGPNAGLRGMLARWFTCHQLDREQALQRVADHLVAAGIEDPEEWAAVTEVITPTTEAELVVRDVTSPTVRFASSQERYVLLGRLLRRMAAIRPVVVWVDDVQWGLDALRFVAHLLDAQQERPAPALVLLTAREETLAERRAEAAELAEVMEREGTEWLEVGPLMGEHRSSLVRELLGLEGDLARRVEARTAGNPLFAVQLVGDWVQRGLLEPGASGFVLKPGARVDLPDDVHQVWRARIDRLLEGREEWEGWALELAAMLGQQVDGAEWADACARAGLAVPEELTEALVDQRLSRCGPLGGEVSWFFVHGMLRESLVRRAREQGRFAEHNRACAAMLRQRSGPGVAERLATHLEAAGYLEEALAPLLQATKERVVEGAYGLAEGLLERSARIVDQAGLAEDDAWRGGQAVARCVLERHRGDLGEASAWARRALAASEEHGWAGIRAEALLEEGVLERLRGETDRARELFGEAEEWAEAIGDEHLVARCRQEQGDAWLRHGDLEAAEARYARAREAYAELEDDEGVGKCLRGMAGIARQAGRLDDAAHHLEEAVERFRRCGSRWGMGACTNDLAELARLRGDLETAASGYEDALKRYRAIGSGNAVFPEINLGIVLGEQGRHERAAEVLLEALAEVESEGRRPLMAAVHAFLLPALAAAGDWEEQARHAALAEELLAETGFVDVDIARALEQAGERAVAASRVDAARQAWALALGQWRALDRTDEAVDLQARLYQLGGGETP